MIENQPSEPMPPEPFADDRVQLLEWAARAVGHELSNQLLAIQWCGSLLDDGGGDPAALREVAHDVEDAVARGRSALAFLSLLVGRAGQNAVGVRELLGHGSNLIRQALGSTVGVELDADRCATCRLDADPRGFIQVLTRLAAWLAGGRPSGVLRIEARTFGVAGDGSDRPRLAVSLRGRTRAGEPPPEEAVGGSDPRSGAAGIDELAEVAAYVEHRLGGRLTRQSDDGPFGCRLRVVVGVVELPEEEEIRR